LPRFARNDNKEGAMTIEKSRNDICENEKGGKHVVAQFIGQLCLMNQATTKLF
jgi:hypothetical protein